MGDDPVTWMIEAVLFSDKAGDEESKVVVSPTSDGMSGVIVLLVGEGVSVLVIVSLAIDD